MKSIPASSKGGLGPPSRSAKFSRRLGASLIAVTILASLRSHADVCPVPTFAPARTFDAGAAAESMTAGDFNGDGKLDLAVATRGSYDATTQSYTNSGVAILLGKGDGNFGPAVTYRAGRNPPLTYVARTVVIADVNADGKLDLLVATNPGLSVLLGKGDGVFNEEGRYAESTSASSLAVGDFNGDGRPDVILGKDDGVSVLLGNGEGAFRTTVNYNVASLSLAVADFNGDGKADLAVGDGVNISVLLGNGDGTFQTSVRYEAAARSVAVSDFNGDGKPDLVAVGNDANGGRATVLLGKGDGTFQVIVNRGGGAYPFSVAVSDLNGDGKPDLAVGNGGFEGLISVLLGNGDGTFQLASIGARAAGVAIGDVNGDGKPDLISHIYLTSISVMINEGVAASSPLSFAQSGSFQAYGYGGFAAVGDFNADGKPDLVVGDGMDSRLISVLLANGDGGFHPAVRYRAGVKSSHVTVGDFNGDGNLDLAAGNDGSLSVLLGKGDGTFLAATKTGTGATQNGTVVGDFNGDGKLDLAQVNYGSGNVGILLGNGDGTFQPAVKYTAGASPSGFAIGDFNSDGKLDVAVANADDTNRVGASVLLGRGDGTFEQAVALDTGGDALSLAVGDFNGDGRPDVILGKDDGVSVLLGNGDGSFQPINSYHVVSGGMVPSGPAIAVGDLNGDGNADLIVVGYGISILLGHGDGTFRPAVNYPGYKNYGVYSSVGLGDFNGDGKLDFVTVFSDDFAGTPATVWLNTSFPTGPVLAITRNGAAFTVSWPFPSPGYVCESSAGLSPTIWKLADGLPMNSKGRWEVTVPATQSQGFFRLRKP